MINYIEIKIECIDHYDGEVPDDVVFEHLLHYYRYNTGAILPMVSIEVGSDDSLRVIRNAFYINLAKKLGIKQIRAAILNGSERIMQLYNECILIKDMRFFFESEEKNAAFDDIYELVYFRDRMSLQDYESIISMFKIFVTEQEIDMCSFSSNIEENYLTLYLKTSKSRFLKEGNALFIFLENLNHRYRIDTLNGQKIEIFLPKA